MEPAPSKTLTLAEFMQLPETTPANEYIEGQIIQKPMHQGKHSVIQGELVPTINSAVKQKRIARAFPELRCTFGGRSTVPDVAVFRWERIPRNENGEIANTFSAPPDWTIEILSPDQSQTKVTKNVLHCLQHGTEVGWLIDPGEQTVFIYRPKHEPEALDKPEQIIYAPEFASDLKLTIQEMFAWLFE